MEVIIQTQELDMEFKSAGNSPYPSAPSTPTSFGHYYYTSAPTSPSRLSEFYQEFDDFAFDVCEDVDESSVSAEDLFDGGMIKPIKTPLPIAHPSSSSKHILDSRNKKENIDYDKEGENKDNIVISQRSSRGRERNPSLSSSSRRAARSVSPLRVSQYPWEEVKQKQSSSSSTLASSSSGKGQRKWRLKDFFLFRSASEGRASDKDGLKKYISLFRGSESPASSNGSSTRRRNGTQISAHELHYKTNRSAKKELKKKTYLPYKPGFFGRIQFNPAMAMTNGFPVYK